MKQWGRAAGLAYAVLGILWAIVAIFMQIAILGPAMAEFNKNLQAQVGQNNPLVNNTTSTLQNIGPIMGLVFNFAYPITMLVLMLLPAIKDALSGKSVVALDDADDDPDAAASAAADAANDDTEAAQEPNKVVGPLTDEELRAGGLDRMVAFIRKEPTKDSIRKRKHRGKQQHKDRKRQMNIVVPDNDRSRTTIRATATAIEDEMGHQAIEVILANSDLRPLIVDVAVQPELREIVDLARRKDDRQQTVTAALRDAAKLVVERPGIVGLMNRATTTARIQETVEMAIANPEYVVLGRIVATQRSICAWLVRRLLRVRRRPEAKRNQ